MMVVDLEKLIPADHLLRRIQRKVDFGFVYERVKRLYKAGGRPSVDPVVLVKMWLIGYLYGIDSERRLEQEVHLNLAYRWFLGLNLSDRVPDHSTFSVNRNKRFRGTDLFKDIFEHTVGLCQSVGLVQSETVVTDSTHIKANASSDSAETVVVTKSPGAYLQSLEARARELDEQLRKKRPGNRQGKPPEMAEPQPRTETRSKTDPDAGMLARPGKPHGFHYLAHVTVETSHGVILDIEPTAASINDHEPYAGCISRVAQKHEVKQAAADSAYDCAEVHRTLSDLGITGYIPSWYRTGPSGPDQQCLYFRTRDFVYEPAIDAYRCPAGEMLTLHAVCVGKRIYKLYDCSPATCGSCELRHKCISPSSKRRQLKRMFDQEHTEQARERNRTPEHKALQALRRVWCEGTNALLKGKHCLRRAMRRGLHNMREQVQMAAAALNLWKLVTA
jgi:transposase